MANQKWTNQSNWQHSEKTKGTIKNGQARATGNIVRNQKGNHKWTSQSNWQHREKTKGAIKDGKARATGKIERKPKGQS